MPDEPRIWWRMQSGASAVSVKSTSIVPCPAEADSRLAEAETWLQRMLANGPQPSKLIIEQASRAGLSEITLRRAFKQLGGRCQKLEFDGGWMWELP